MPNGTYERINKISDTLPLNGACTFTPFIYRHLLGEIIVPALDTWRCNPKQAQELIEPDLQKYETVSKCIKCKKLFMYMQYFVGILQSTQKFVFITTDLDHISEEFNFALLSSILNANIRVSQ